MPLSLLPSLTKARFLDLIFFRAFPVGIVKVEMVDIGIQSETEDLSDNEAAAQQTGKRPTMLQVVPEVEEEHEQDNELVYCGLNFKIIDLFVL